MKYAATYAYSAMWIKISQILKNNRNSASVILNLAN